MKNYDEKRLLILEASIKAFATFGYYKTTLEDIAKMCGMKKNSLYYYFKSKDDLFKEIILSEIDSFYGEQEEILNRKISNSKKIEIIMLQIVNFIRKRTMKYTVKLSSYLEISSVIKKQFSDFNKKQCKIIEQIVKEGISSGEFKKINAKKFAEDLGELLPALVNNAYLISEATFVNEVNFNEVENRIKRIMKYIIEGIKK